jgi:hypothetical protein
MPQLLDGASLEIPLQFLTSRIMDRHLRGPEFDSAGIDTRLFFLRLLNGNESSSYVFAVPPKSTGARSDLCGR